jgi:hypothetical protein
MFIVIVLLLSLLLLQVGVHQDYLPLQVFILFFKLFLLTHFFLNGYYKLTFHLVLGGQVCNVLVRLGLVANVVFLGLRFVFGSFARDFALALAGCLRVCLHLGLGVGRLHTFAVRGGLL